MPKDRTAPVTQPDGDEEHPAFGVIGVHRVHSTPGEVLFQSDLRHQEYIVLRVSEASRKRDLKRDWVHPGRRVCEVSMSLAQFAAFVSSGGTEGVPCTIEFAGSGSREPGQRPGLLPASRLSVTNAEVRDAAHKAYEGIQEALAEYEQALADPQCRAAARRSALATLRNRVGNAAGNVEFAAQALDEHAENVVATSRADIEAMAAQAAQRLGLPSAAPLAISGAPRAIASGDESGGR
jgi:hypothetical protein